MPQGEEHMSRAFSFSDYMEQLKNKWHQFESKYGLDATAYDYGTWGFVDFIFARTWGDEASVEKASTHGWTKTVDSVKDYYAVFDRMEELKMIPQ